MPESVVEPPTAELTPEELEEKLKVQLVDVSHGVAANAVDAADEYISEQTSQGGVVGFAKKIWHGNLARDFIRQRHIQRNREDITESGNLYSLSEGSQADHDEAMAAVVNRFTSEYGLLHQNETNQALEETDRGRGFMNQVKQLVNAYARDELGWDALVEERTRIVQEYGAGAHSEDRNKGLLYADNILEVAHNAKLAAEHDIALERINAAIKGNVGEARMGVRTEAQSEKIDKIVDRLYQTKVGSLVNETTLVGSISLAMNLAKVTTRKAVTAAGATLGFGVGAAVIAGAREHLHYGQERRLHMRQMAEGGQMAPDSRRREKLETTRYETVSVQELIENLEAASNEVNLVGETDPARLQDLIFHISRTQSMVDMSDDRKLDLISFSRKTAVENERLALDIKLAEAKVALQKILDTTPGEQLASAGLSSNLDELVNEKIDQINDAFNEEISDKDRVFRKLRARRTIGMAALGGAMGIGVGLGVQELKSVVDSGLHGVFEGSGHGENRDTLLAGFLHHGTDGAEQHSTHGASHLQLFDKGHLHHGGMRLPEGYHLGNGGHSLIGPDGNPVAEHLQWDHNGHLSETSQQALTEKGFNLSSLLHHYHSHHTISDKIHTSPKEFFSHHHHGFIRDHRQLWYDNNTHGTYDLNELRMDWGSGGTGIDQHGNYVFNVSRMTPDGSFHDGLSTNAQHLAHEGKLAVALSMTKGSQQYVQIIHIDANGNAIIPKDSIAGQSMFVNDGGHARFVGAYAETVQVLSQSKDHGVHTRMLATVVGENHAHRFSEIVHHTVSHKGEYYITHIEAPAAAMHEIPVEIPPVIPVYARRGLEALGKNIDLTDVEIGGNYYGGKSLQDMREWIKADPKRLKTRKLINTAEGEKWLEADDSEVERSVSRERKVLKEYLDKEKTRDADHYGKVEAVANAMKPMANKCRVSINVPAWLEARNLRSFLDQYTKQINKSGESLDSDLYEINLLVNRKRGTEGDNSIEVIKKFVDDFKAANGFEPKINYYDVEVDPPYNTVGYARKLLTDAVIMRSLSRDNQEGSLYIESEDADMVMIDPKTVANVIEKLDNNPQLDAVRGVQDRAPQYMKDNDFLFFKRRTYDFFEIFARSKRFRDPRNPNWNYTFNRIITGGWNTAYTAEAYALIDGYENLTAGEDMTVGEKITMVRGDGNFPNLEVIGKVYSRSDASPRRFIHEIRSDRGAYDDFMNEEDNRKIREESVEEALQTIQKYARINESNQEALSRYLNGFYHGIQNVTPTRADANDFAKRLLFFLGFKKDDYEIGEDKIIVKNWNNVKEALENYRRRYAAKAAVGS